MKSIILVAIFSMIGFYSHAFATCEAGDQRIIKCDAYNQVEGEQLQVCVQTSSGMEWQTLGEPFERCKTLVSPIDQYGQ